MTTRRTVIKSAVWAVPVVAVAAAVPLATASQVPERIPVSCILLNGTGVPQYNVEYSSGPSAIMSRNEIVQDKRLKEICPVPARGNEGGTQ